MNIINRFHSLFIKPPYHYGVMVIGGNPKLGQYRLNNSNGDIEYRIQRIDAGVLWHRMDQSWKPFFEPFERG